MRKCFAEGRNAKVTACCRELLSQLIIRPSLPVAAIEEHAQEGLADDAVPGDSIDIDSKRVPAFQTISPADGENDGGVSPFGWSRGPAVPRDDRGIQAYQTMWTNSCGDAAKLTIGSQEHLPEGDDSRCSRNGSDHRPFHPSR